MDNFCIVTNRNKDINLEIKQCVDQINSISEQIATLNKQINVIELSGSRANESSPFTHILPPTLSTAEQM